MQRQQTAAPAIAVILTAAIYFEKTFCQSCPLLSKHDHADSHGPASIQRRLTDSWRHCKVAQDDADITECTVRKIPYSSNSRTWSSGAHVRP